MDITPPVIADALARLTAFRASFNDGDKIDDASHLTAADLGAIIARCGRMAEDAVIDKLGNFA